MKQRALLLIFLINLSLSTLAFGPVGHQIVADVAYNNLKKSTKKKGAQVRRLSRPVSRIHPLVSHSEYGRSVILKASYSASDELSDFRTQVFHIVNNRLNAINNVCFR